jgi:hypothetical protein
MNRDQKLLAEAYKAIKETEQQTKPAFNVYGEILKILSDKGIPSHEASGILDLVKKAVTDAYSEGMRAGRVIYGK